MSAGTPRRSIDLLRASIGRVDRATNPGEAGEALLEAWQGAESAMQQLAGSTVLRGQDLIRELRGRDLLSLSEAHAFVELGTIADRVQAGHEPAIGELAAARAKLETILGVVERRGSPRVASAASAPEPIPVHAPDVQAVDITPSRRNVAGRVIVVGALLAMVGVGGWLAWSMTREPSELRRGRAAYAAGDRLTARNEFSAASGRYPARAEPLIYLGRISREEGDLMAARDLLRRAVALEPANPLGHRELASVMLASGRPDLARSFYERAIRLDQADRTAQGYMGCTLVQLGRPDLARRFLARAGQGPWSACAVPVAPPPPPTR